MSIQSNVNQAISLAGLVAAAAGRDLAETNKINREASRVSEAFIDLKKKSDEAALRYSEDSDNPDVLRQSIEALKKETMAYEKEAEIAGKLFEKNPNSKTAELKRKAEVSLQQQKYSLEIAEETYKSFTPEKIAAHAKKTKLEQKEAEAARNREAMREAELRRIRQLSPKSALRYENKLMKKEAK